MKMALLNMFMAGAMFPILVSEIAINKPLYVISITFFLFIGNLIFSILNYRNSV